MRRYRLLLILAIGLLPACSGELQTPGEALRIFGDSLPQAYLGEPYEAQVRAVGGLRPFSYGLEHGVLPPGLSLEAGVISGRPTETGSFDFTIAVSDANLSKTFQEYSLSVVERPPPTLTVVAPQTEVRTAVTVRLQVENASELRAFTALLSWDEADFELAEGSVEAAVDGSALVWQSEPGSLQLDMAAMGRAWNGKATLAQLTLVPVRTAVLRPRLEATFLDDRNGTHFQAAPGGPQGPAGESDGDAESEPGTDGQAPPGDDETSGETTEDAGGPAADDPGANDPSAGSGENPSGEDAGGEDPAGESSPEEEADDVSTP